MTKYLKILLKSMKKNTDCWLDDPQKFLGKKYKAEDFEKLSDIVEVWFDSGSTHSFVLEKRKDLKGLHQCTWRLRPIQRMVSFIFA